MLTDISSTFEQLLYYLIKSVALLTAASVTKHKMEDNTNYQKHFLLI